MNLDGWGWQLGHRKLELTRIRCRRRASHGSSRRVVFESLEARQMLYGGEMHFVIVEHDNAAASGSSAALEIPMLLGALDGEGEFTESPVVSIDAVDRMASEVGPNSGMIQLSCGGNCANLAVSLSVSGSATSGSDYRVRYPGVSGGPFPTSVTFSAAGQLFFEIVPVVDSVLNEGWENVVVSIVAQTRYVIGSPQTAEVKIEDAPPQSIVYVTTQRNTAEGSATTGLWMVRRNVAGPALDVDVEIGSCPSPSTACATDYTLVSPGIKRVTFAAGSLTATYSPLSPTMELKAIDDTMVEGVESVQLRILPATGYSTRTNDSTYPDRASIQIADNDGGGGGGGGGGGNGGGGGGGGNTIPALSISGATGHEGSPLSFRITLDRPSTSSVTVDYFTIDGSAINSVDYLGFSESLRQTATFAPNETEKIVSIDTIDDAICEPSEDFYVQLKYPTNATIATGQGKGIILDPYDTPNINVSNPRVVEGQPEIFNLAFANGKTCTTSITVMYETIDATARQGLDYNRVWTMSTFAAGQSVMNVVVPTIDDTLVEQDETFVLNVWSPKAVSTGTATIIDNDQPKPEIAISDVKVKEGNSGTVDAVFTVSVLGSLQGPVTLNYVTQDGLAQWAIPEFDYQPLTGGTLTFVNGLSQTITVKVNGDQRKEYNEDFKVKLNLVSGGLYATLVDDTGVGTIEDDDQSMDPHLIYHLPHCACPCNPCDAGGQEVQAKNGGMNIQPQSSFALLPGFQSDSTFNTRPIFNVVMNLPADATLPTYIQATPRVGNQQGDPHQFRPGEFKAGAQVEFGVMIDISDLDSGVYPLTIEIQAVFADGKKSEAKIEDVFPLINLLKSPFGKWASISGVNRLLLPKQASPANANAALVSGSAAAAPAPAGLALATGDNTAWWFPERDAAFATPAGSFMNLAKNNTLDPESLYTLTDKYGDQQVFNKDGFLRKRIDRNSNETVYSYADNDGDGVREQLTEIRDPLGRKTTYRYLNGQLDRVIDFAGRETKYVYGDQSLRIDHPIDNGATGIVYASETYTFDLAGRVISSKDKRDQITQYTYDAVDKRLISIRRPDGTTTTMNSAQRNGLPGAKQSEYYDFRDPAAIYATMTDGRGNTTKFRVDDFGNLLEQINPEPNTGTRIERDPISGLVKRIVAPANNGAGGESVTEYLDYDARGNLLRMRLPNGAVRTWTYDSTFSQVKTYVDELGRETRYVLDDRGNVLNESHVQLAVAAGPGFVGAANRPWQNPRNKYDVNDDGLVSAADTLSIASSGWPILPDPPTATNKPAPYFDVNGDGRVSSNDILMVNNYLNTRPLVVTSFTYTAPGGSLPAGLLLTTTDALGMVTEHTYSTAMSDFGWLKSVKYAKGTTEETSVRYEYDSMGNVKAVIDPLAHRSVFQYDLANRLTRLIGADPDGPGPLSKPETVYEYDKQGNLIRTTDANQRVTSREYDALNRLQKVVLPTINGVTPTTELSYDANGNLTSIKDAELHETKYEYNKNNWLTLTIFPAPAATAADHGVSTVQQTYDGQGNFATTIDQLGRTTTFNYDRSGHLAQIRRDGEAAGERFVYDAAGQLISTIDPLGRDTRFAYDDLGRQVGISQTSAAPGESRPLTVFAFDDANNLRFTSDALRNVTEHQYDKLNRQVKTIQPDPDASGPLLRPESSFLYYANGLLRKSRDPLGRETEFKYDDLGRLNETIFPDSDGSGPVPAPKMTATYDAVGNLTEQTQWNGTTNYTTRYEYQNPLYLASREIDPNGFATQYTYDRVGNRRSVTDPDNNTTTFVYDNLNRLIEERNQLGKSRYSHYDPVGNLTWTEDRNGRRVFYGYDGWYRLTSERWGGANGGFVREMTWQNDLADQLIAVSDSAAAYAFRYDGLGRLDEQRSTLVGAGQGLIVVDPSYDAAGNRISLATRLGASLSAAGSVTGGSADFVNTYTYDKLQRMTSVSQKAQVLNPQSPPGSPAVANAVSPKMVQLDYKSDGQLDAIRRYFDGAAVQLVASSLFGYDAAGKIAVLSHRSNVGSTIASHTWTYDGANRVTSYQNNVDGLASYTYDNAGQLKGANQPGLLPGESFNYSNNGNRIGGTYSVGTNNRLTSDGTYNYAHDDEGNRTRRTKISDGSYTQYVWDHRNRLTSVIDRNSLNSIVKQSDYSYDVLNQRISKQVDPDGSGPAAAWKEYYLWDDDQIILSFRDANVADQMQPALNHRFLHGPAVDMILAQEDVTSTSSPGKTLWSLTDNQGTVRDVVDNSGSVLNHLAYGAFGNVTAETNAAVDFLFGYTGRDRDEETGLAYYRARYYDPTVGRFLSEDPLSFSSGDPNLNRYVENSPTNGTDPSGLESWFWKFFIGEGNSKQHKQNVATGQALRSEMLCKTTGSNAAMRYSAEFQGQWPSEALTAAENTSIDVATTFIPGPADDAIVGATRARNINTIANAANGVTKLSKSAVKAPSFAKSAAKYVYDAATKQYRHVASGRFVAAKDLPWPPNAGFSKKSKTVLSPGLVIDRLGSSSGRYASEAGASISKRGMAPGSENMPLTRYRVMKPLTCESGPAAPVKDFDAIGGAIQYLLPDTLEALVKSGLLKVIK